MTELMQQWEGVSLPGDLILEKCLGSEDRSAFFQTRLPSSGRRAVVKLVPETGADASVQLESWQRARQLRHPNLLEILDCGRAELSGAIVQYAVFEFPDDTLASALANAPLTTQEAREVLDSLLDGLRYLHSQNFVIGKLDADHIVAVGERVKLSTDSVRPAADASAFSADIRLLGDFWTKALMQASPRGVEVAPHASDPNPATRWTLGQISAALSTPVLPPPRPREPEPEPAAPSVPYHFPKWIIVGAAGLLLLILALNLRRPPEVATAPPSSSTPVTAPPIPVKAPAPGPVVHATKASPVAEKEKWRVIAFTYRTREAAAKKVQQINQNHPDLHASIFSPKNKGLYLVALGGPMTHEEAVRIQRTARGKGLPRDLYVQNYERP